MAFTFTITHQGVLSSKKVVRGTWTATSVTSGSIVTGLSNIDHVNITNKTGVRASTAVDTTTTAGTIALSGVTANDVGTFEAIGE